MIRGNTLCLHCRTLNACADNNHVHVFLGTRARPPKRNAREKAWKTFFTTFAGLFDSVEDRRLVCDAPRRSYISLRVYDARKIGARR